MENEKLVPKLRFGEFDDEWKPVILSNVSDVRDGTHDSPKYLDEGYPLITSKNLMKNGTISFEDINLISEEDYNFINKRSKVNSGDILFGMIGTIGNPVIIGENSDFAIKNVYLVHCKNIQGVQFRGEGYNGRISPIITLYMKCLNLHFRFKGYKTQ